MRTGQPAPRPTPPDSTKNRVDPDVRSPVRRREVERLRALGATVLDGQVDGFAVMCDPEANEFCVVG